MRQHQKSVFVPLYTSDMCRDFHLYSWTHSTRCVLPLAKGWSQDLGNKKNHTHTHTPLLLVSTAGFDKSSTPAEGEDTKFVATARGPLSGFTQRNLKHLKFFDHNLILEEATIYSRLARHLSSHPHSSPGGLNGRVTTRLRLILAMLKASFHQAFIAAHDETKTVSKHLYWKL